MKQLQRVYVPQFLAPGVNKELVCFNEPQAWRAEYIPTITSDDTHM